MEKGYDAGKKVSGIKRHIAVDTQGLPHAIAVTTADITDRKGCLLALERDKDNLGAVQKVLTDGGYTGQAFASSVQALIGAEVEIAKRIAAASMRPCTIPASPSPILKPKSLARCVLPRRPAWRTPPPFSAPCGASATNTPRCACNCISAKRWRICAAARLILPCAVAIMRWTRPTSSRAISPSGVGRSALRPPGWSMPRPSTPPPI